MQIGNLNLDRQVLVVAEIGNNHEGKFAVAYELVQRAAECGVDAVKFQTFQTRYFVSEREKARYDRLRTFELSYQQFADLQKLAKSLGLLFISTPLDLESAAFLERIVDCFKIASGDNDFYPLIEQVCRTGKPLIVSSGLSDLAHIKRTVAFVHDQWRARGITQKMAVLHCVSAYPVPPEQANVAAVRLLTAELPCTVGYSDHTIGSDAAVLAVTLGARIVEKHFTLDKNFSDFRDHQLSADPSEMRLLVARIRQALTLLGAPEKTVQPCEAAGLTTIRRSIVAGRDLPRGHRIAFADLTWIRPGGGLRPGEEQTLVGKVLRRGVGFGEQLHPDDVEGPS